MTAIPKLTTSSKGKPMHFSVGAIIQRDRKYLLIDRVKPPFGFAGVAGHVDEGETPEEALQREVEEESGLVVQEYRLLYEEEIEKNICSKGTEVHYWYLYECIVEGEIKHNTKETKSIRWYTKEEIKKLTVEPVWGYWFTKLMLL